MERWSEELRRRAVMDRFNPSSVMGTPLPDSEESDIDGSQIPNSQQNVSRAGGGSSSQSPFVSTGLHGGPRPFMQQAPFMPPFYPPGMVAPSFFTPPALHMQSNGSSVVHRPQPRDDFPAPPPPAPNFVAEVHNVSVPVASNHRPQVHDFTQPDAAPSVQSTDPGSSNGAGSSQASRERLVITSVAHLPM
ncbi:hypothetical protein R1sor_005111 [Riccia sorocarpa]|uniref:Uncharacterized protein n=1 Tax=Riccia sorocarpa TaxID=122646 RepID=A0ABD3HMY0_9MARC